jgi:DNA-binding NarL/FixJ family response regulator
VVAGSPVVRAGLRALLKEAPGIEVVDSVSPGEADHVRGDLIVMDGGADLASQLEMDGPGVVLLTSDTDAARQSDLWPSRLRAILPDNAPAAEIVAAVQAVAAGFVLLRPEEAARTFLPRAAAAGGDSLTPRELEVLQMIAAGESNKRIAWRLGISEHTVKFHVASILSKLAAGSRAEAVTVGIRRGLIYL